MSTAEGPRGIARIVVGVDGSPHAAAAMDWVVRMARGMGSEVTAVFALSPPVYFDTGYAAPTIPVQYDTDWRTQVTREFEDEWCKPLRDAGVKYKTVVEDGRPASAIIAIANRVGADVVVVGRRGRGGFTELLLGSVSHELVLHCKRPVLVISG